MIDLRGLPYMPLYIERLQKSKAWLLCKREPEIAFYLMNLWMRAWQEVPAGTIENDDDVLADAAMCDTKRWAKVRDKALRGWTEIGGRLTHPVVSEIAEESWSKREAYKARTDAARKAREEKRRLEREANAGSSDEPPDRGSTPPVAASVTETVTTSVTEAATEGVTDSKYKGKGKLEDKKDSDPNGSGAGAPSLEALVFQRGKALLGKNGGGQVTKLRKAYGGDDGAVLATLNEAAMKENPAEWLAATIRHRSGEQETDELGLPVLRLDQIGKSTDDLYRRLGVEI